LQENVLAKQIIKLTLIKKNNIIKSPSVCLKCELYLLYRCFKIGKFRIQSVVGKDPVELVNTFKKIALPDIWTTETL
jgi:hypothetical protein